MEKKRLEQRKRIEYRKKKEADCRYDEGCGVHHGHVMFTHLRTHSNQAKMTRREHECMCMCIDRWMDGMFASLETKKKTP
jgi:hypothetical protein